jgi:hypothetical protein
MAAQELARLGWLTFITNQQKPTSLHPNLHHLAHPAGPFLQRIAMHGVSAPSHSIPWTLTQKDAAVARGPHPSAS